jgi:lipoprotein-anchoring transpeptidase ErfK/SrfK
VDIGGENEAGIDANRFHAGPAGRFDARFGIFDNDGAWRRDAEPFGGEQEYLGIGLAERDVLGGHDGFEVVGEIQITHVQGEDTLSDIARRFNVGYEEILRANPGVDPWLPGVGREIVVPTQFVLPDAPREGLVVNLAQLRVFYYPKPAKLKKGEVDDGLRTVITHPIGIGKIGWQTPEGTTKVTSKQKNPTWTPPVSSGFL